MIGDVRGWLYYLEAANNDRFALLERSSKDLHDVAESFKILKCLIVWNKSPVLEVPSPSRFLSVEMTCVWNVLCVCIESRKPYMLSQENFQVIKTDEEQQ
jgi:hypothetical protein